MKRIFCTLAISASLLVACSAKPEAGAIADGNPRTEADSTKQAGSQLAYVHTVSARTGNNDVETLYHKLEAQCQADSSNRCSMLSTRLHTGDSRSAHLRLRAKPAGIQAILKTLAQGAEITSQASEAEDLAQPIADSAKHIAMLRSYQAKLDQLGSQAGKDLDSLMHLANEQARVQSELESALGQSAKLEERISTEVLQLDISSSSDPGQASPLWRAGRHFTANLEDGTAVAITAVAYLLPWAFLAVVLIYAWRWLRQRRQARAAATAAAAAAISVAKANTTDPEQS
jgi:hypothetical protein